MLRLAAFMSRQDDDRNETQSLIFSLLIGITLQLAGGNNSAFALFETEDSFIKVAKAVGAGTREIRIFFLRSLNDPLAPCLLHTQALELTLRPPRCAELREMGGKWELTAGITGSGFALCPRRAGHLWAPLVRSQPGGPPLRLWVSTKDVPGKGDVNPVFPSVDAHGDGKESVLPLG